MRLPRRCHLYLFIAGLPIPAHAQQSAPGGPVAQVEVKGGAASYDPRRDDTATRIVIGRQEIERYGDTSVFDLFRRIPGLTVTQGAGRAARCACAGWARAIPRSC